jgi:hypothetical protein
MDDEFLPGQDNFIIDPEDQRVQLLANYFPSEHYKRKKALGRRILGRSL